MSYSKDEGHSYLDFDDNISSFHQIVKKLVHLRYTVFVNINIDIYTSCLTMKFVLCQKSRH